MLMKIVRFGAARFVITEMTTPCSQINKRFAAPGGNVKHTGRLGVPGKPGNAGTFVHVEFDNPCPWAESTAPIAKNNHKRKTPRIERQNLPLAVIDVNTLVGG